MRTGALTLLVPVRRDRVEELTATLNMIGKDIKRNPHIHFTTLTLVHFARWVMLPPTTDGGWILAFESNYDGLVQEHLNELLHASRVGLHLIYSHCVDYGSELATDDSRFLAYLLRHRVPESAAYAAYSGLTVMDIRRTQAFRATIDTSLDRPESLTQVERQGAVGLVERLRSLAISVQPGLSRMPVPSPFLRWFALALILLAAIGIFVLLFPIFTLWFVVLRILERSDAPMVSAGAPSVVSLRAREDFQVQNQLTHLVEVKSGTIRLVTLILVLKSVNLLARWVFTQGTLGGIPSIHFARWVLLPDRRLLFFSNYDGSWENYLGDFVDRAAFGLTGIWSNTLGFPPTRFLVFEGARHEVDFKLWARSQQIETQVWYSAHEDLTVQNILANRRIHRELSRPVRTETAAATLAGL